jgi:hypothetical protein
MTLVQQLRVNRPNNLGDLQQRNRAEVKSSDIIERSVQSVGKCQMVGGR